MWKFTSIDEVRSTSSWILAQNGFSLAETTVQTLGLKMEEAGEDRGVGEKTVHVSRTHLAEAQLGDLQFRDLEADVYPLGDAGNVFGYEAC